MTLPYDKLPVNDAEIWIETVTPQAQGERRITLLELVDEACSVWQAAQQLKLSYPAAIAELDAVNNLSDRPLLIRAVSGVSGGNAYLTEYGRRAVRLYRSLQTAQERVFQRMAADFSDFNQLHDLLRAITVKTSARNQLRGKIKTIHRGTVNTDVILDLGDATEIFANVTNDVVEDLALTPGRDATALINASSILLSPDPDVRISARNQLRGTITDVIAGVVNCQIKLQLASGRTIVAMITEDALRDLDLDEGSECTALIKASHVLIAVNN